MVKIKYLNLSLEKKNIIIFFFKKCRNTFTSLKKCKNKIINNKKARKC